MTEYAKPHIRQASKLLVNDRKWEGNLEDIMHDLEGLVSLLLLTAAQARPEVAEDLLRRCLVPNVEQILSDWESENGTGIQ